MITLDSISIWISVFALCISALTLYFTIFHKKHSLVAVLANWTNDEDPENLESVCEIGLFNNGNRDLLIQSVEIDLSAPRPSTLYPELELDNVPCSLNAGKSRLLRLRIPKRFMETAQAANCLLKVVIYIYTLEGELRIATKKLVPVAGDMHPSPLDWTPFSLRKVKASDRQ